MILARVILFAKDLPRMEAFYRDALGMKVLAVDNGFIRLDAGHGIELALHAIPPQYAQSIAIADPPAPRESAPIKLVFVVDDPAALGARLAAHGGRLLAHPPDAIDPEGNVFRLVAKG